jgi:hypothetical protein
MKRILTSATVAFGIAMIFPLVNAAGRPMSDSGSGIVTIPQTHAPIVSEKTAGLLLPAQTKVVVSSAPIVSEKTAGLQLPSQPETPIVVATGSGFDWSDAGIGAGAMTGLLLATLAATMVVRRRHGTFAH